MENVFWLGVYPALGEPHLDYVLDVLHELAEGAFHRDGNAARGRI
jgi:hypothetical protein